MVMQKSFDSSSSWAQDIGLKFVQPTLQQPCKQGKFLQIATLQAMYLKNQPSLVPLPNFCPKHKQESQKTKKSRDKVYNKELSSFKFYNLVGGRRYPPRQSSLRTSQTQKTPLFKEEKNTLKHLSYKYSFQMSNIYIHGRDQLRRVYSTSLCFPWHLNKQWPSLPLSQNSMQNRD